MISTFVGSLGAAEATPRIQFRVAFFNIYNGLGSAGGATYNAIEQHIQRIQPDILGFSEVLAGDETALRSNFMPDNGYTDLVMGRYRHTTVQPALLSKFPVSSSEYVESTAPADEFIREPVYAEIDIGHDTKTLAVYAMHTEAWCYTAPCSNVIRPALEFRRAVEWIRVKEHWQAKVAANPSLVCIAMGDTNDDPESPQTKQWATQPTLNEGWGGFAAGPLTYPIRYRGYPRKQAAEMGLDLLESTDLDGGRATIWTVDPNAALTVPIAIDFIAKSPALQDEGHEILSSEATQTGGLTKHGDPLPFESSRDASDHKCIFADLALVG